MPLVWDIRKTGDVEPGIYFYRVKVGTLVKEGKVVGVR